MLDINFTAVLIGFAVLLVSLTVHEMAHAWTADRLGDHTARMLGRVSLNPLVHIDPIGTVLFPLLSILSPVPLLGWAKPVPVNVRNLRQPGRDYALIAAAGPASNLAMAAIAAPLLGLIPVTPMVINEASASVYVAAFLARMVTVNVMLAVFNMLPIPPLDGGNVLIALLPRPLASIVAQVRPYGFLVLYALILTDGISYLVIAPSDFIIRSLLL